MVQNLMKGEPLKLVEGGKSQRTFIYIKDAIDVVQRMIVSSLWPLLGGCVFVAVREGGTL